MKYVCNAYLWGIEIVWRILRNLQRGEKKEKKLNKRGKRTGMEEKKRKLDGERNL